MNPGAPPPRRPYWLLGALAAAVLSPPMPIAAGVIAAAFVGEQAIRGLMARIAPLEQPSSRAPADGLTIGRADDGSPVRLTEQQLSAHALILGASGTGKTTTLLRILTEHVRRGRPVVAMDLKGSPALAHELATAARAAGRPFRLWTPDGPDHWNPLSEGNATELKDKLMATERFTEPHYARAAERYVQTVLQVLLDPSREGPPTLGAVVALMDPRRLAVSLRGVQPELAERVRDYLAELTPDQWSAIRGLGSRLAIVSESHTGVYLRPGPGPSIDLRAALAGGEVVLFSLNSSRYGKLAAQLGTLAVQDLIAAAGERLAAMAERGLAHPQALIGIDEFSALQGDNVISLLARGREAGLSVLLATQELADLERAGRGLRDQVLGNTAVKIAHRQEVPASAQTIAQLVGTRPAWEETRQTRAPGLLGRSDTGRGTRRVVEQFVVHPNAIKTLDTGRAVLITRLPQSGVRTVQVSEPTRGPAER